MGSPGSFELLQSLLPRQLKRFWSSSGWRQRRYSLLCQAFGGSLGSVGLLSAHDCAERRAKVVYTGCRDGV